MSFYNIIELITVIIFVLTALISSIVTGLNRNIPGYMKYFFLYPLVGVLDGVLLLSRKYYPFLQERTVFLIDNYSIIFHFGFLSFFLVPNIFPEYSRSKIWIILTMYLMLLLLLVFAFDSPRINGVAYGTSNAALIIICILYFTRLSKAEMSQSETTLTQQPFFWVINGVFFGMSISIPIVLTSNYFYEVLPRDIYLSMVALRPFGYLVMYLFFIKAYLCLIKARKNSMDYEVS